MPPWFPGLRRFWNRLPWLGQTIVDRDRRTHHKPAHGRRPLAGRQQLHRAQDPVACPVFPPVVRRCESQPEVQHRVCTGILDGLGKAAVVQFSPDELRPPQRVLGFHRVHPDHPGYFGMVLERGSHPGPQIVGDPGNEHDAGHIETPSTGWRQ